MGSEARTRASVKYNKTRDSITIRPDKETGARIRDAAKLRGVTVTEFVMAALAPHLGTIPGLDDPADGAEGPA